MPKLKFGDRVRLLSDCDDDNDGVVPAGTVGHIAAKVRKDIADDNRRWLFLGPGDLGCFVKYSDVKKIEEPAKPEAPKPVFKVGDQVKITEKFEHPLAHLLVGKPGEVIDLRPLTGEVRVGLPSAAWWVSAEVVQLIEEEPPKPEEKPRITPGVYQSSCLGRARVLGLGCRPDRRVDFVVLEPLWKHDGPRYRIWGIESFLKSFTLIHPYPSDN